MSGLFVKICGVRTLADAYAAHAAGADAIGFNFWPQSKRYLPLAEAVVIAKALPPSLTRVGVFVDAAPESIERALASGAISLAQLHGDESPEDCRRFEGRYLKAIRLASRASLDEMARFRCELVLVDADAPGYGGSGARADWALAAEAARTRRMLLAGGLTPENVAEAVRAVRPFGVDVASGVERAPGVKDMERMRAFVAAARGALAAIETGGGA